MKIIQNIFYMWLSEKQNIMCCSRFYFILIIRMISLIIYYYSKFLVPDTYQSEENVEILS